MHKVILQKSKKKLQITTKMWSINSLILTHVVWRSYRWTLPGLELKPKDKINALHHEMCFISCNLDKETWQMKIIKNTGVHANYPGYGGGGASWGPFLEIASAYVGGPPGRSSTSGRGSTGCLETSSNLCIIREALLLLGRPWVELWGGTPCYHFFIHSRTNMMHLNRAEKE